ncbi:MAG: hypothetical protein QXU82_00925 [Candidatus Aenigmatarchaeota archaeon]
MAEIYLPPRFIENSPDTVLAAKLFNRWCLKNNVIPGVPNSFKDQECFSKDSLSPSQDTKNFRYVKKLGQYEVDVAQLYIEPATVRKYNISPGTFKCHHSSCAERSTIDIEIKDKDTKGIYRDKVWFCFEEDGIFKRYLEECPTEARNATARLLRTPSPSTNWFVKYVAKAEHELLKKEWAKFVDKADANIFELTKVFAEDMDGLREEWPEYVGETIYSKMKVLGLDSKSYAYLWNGSVFTAGIKTTTKLWPWKINDIIDGALMLRFSEAEPKTEASKAYVLDARRSVEQMKGEDFIVCTVLTRESETYGDMDRADTNIRKAAGFALDRLVAEGVMKKPKFRELGIYVAGCLQLENRAETSPSERREFVSGNTRFRLMADPKMDFSKVDREFYFYNMAGPALERILNLDVEAVTGLKGGPSENRGIQIGTTRGTKLDEFDRKGCCLDDFM